MLKRKKEKEKTRELSGEQRREQRESRGGSQMVEQRE
jgi:hypothetical protein